MIFELTHTNLSDSDMIYITYNFIRNSIPYTESKRYLLEDPKKYLSSMYKDIHDKLKLTKLHPKNEKIIEMILELDPDAVIISKTGKSYLVDTDITYDFQVNFSSVRVIMFNYFRVRIRDGRLIVIPEYDGARAMDYKRIESHFGRLLEVIDI